MTQDDTKKVKLAAGSLMHRLLEEHPKVLVQDWYKDSQSREVVCSAAEQVLYRFRREAFKRISSDFLESEGIAWLDDVDS